MATPNPKPLRDTLTPQFQTNESASKGHQKGDHPW